MSKVIQLFNQSHIVPTLIGSLWSGISFRIPTSDESKQSYFLIRSESFEKDPFVGNGDEYFKIFYHHGIAEVETEYLNYEDDLFTQLVRLFPIKMSLGYASNCSLDVSFYTVNGRFCREFEIHEYQNAGYPEVNYGNMELISYIKDYAERGSDKANNFIDNVNKLKSLVFKPEFNKDDKIELVNIIKQRDQNKLNTFIASHLS